MPRKITNCRHCNMAFKYESAKQRHEQLDCKVKRPAKK